MVPSTKNFFMSLSNISLKFKVCEKIVNKYYLNESGIIKNVRNTVKAYNFPLLIVIDLDTALGSSYVQRKREAKLTMILYRKPLKDRRQVIGLRKY